MRQFPALVLLLCFAAIGTGTLEYLHNLQHAAEDARADALAQAAGQPIDEHHHDEFNCSVHAQLHLPFVSAGWVPLLVCLGLFVAFVTLLNTPLIPRLTPARIGCRGPPVS